MNMTSYTIYGPEKWEENYISQAHKYLSDIGRDASIKKKMAFELDITKDHPNWYGAVRKYIVFQNNETKQFFMIDHADQYDYLVEELASHPLCIGILKCQYREGHYGSFEDKVSSFTYGVKEWDKYDDIVEEIKGAERVNKWMYFKGNENRRHHILKLLAKDGVINSDYGFRKDGKRCLKIIQDDYLKDMAKSRIAFSLPGVGGNCHREIEAFGLGIPVLMPILRNQYYNKLIPNVHYIAVDNRKISDERINTYDSFQTKLFLKMLINRYQETVDDAGFLKYISDNAMEWFDKNIRYPSAPNLIEKILKTKFNYEL
jgi:hypothetical protein